MTKLKKTSDHSDCAKNYHNPKEGTRAAKLVDSRATAELIRLKIEKVSSYCIELARLLLERWRVVMKKQKLCVPPSPLRNRSARPIGEIREHRPQS